MKCFQMKYGHILVLFARHISSVISIKFRFLKGKSDDSWSNLRGKRSHAGLRNR